MHTETTARLEKENWGYAQEAARVCKDGDTATIALGVDAVCQKVLPISKNPHPPSRLLMTASRPPRHMLRPIVLLPQRKRNPTHVNAATPAIVLATPSSLPAASDQQSHPDRPAYQYGRDQDNDTNNMPIWPRKRARASPPTPSSSSSTIAAGPLRPDKLTVDSVSGRTTEVLPEPRKSRPTDKALGSAAPTSQQLTEPATSTYSNRRPPSSSTPLLPTASRKRSHPDHAVAKPSIPPTKRAHISSPVPTSPFSVGPLPPKAHIEGTPNTASAVPGVIYTDDAGTKLSNRIRRKCFNCHTTDTPTWRRSSLAPGKVVSHHLLISCAVSHPCAQLCNRCGIFENTHSHPRSELSLRKRRRIMKNRAKPQSSAPPRVDHLPPGSVQMPLSTLSPHHRDPEK